MFELVLQAPESLVESVSDALMEELDALSVSVEDSDADTDAEKALFGEPGMPAPKAGWQRSVVRAGWGTAAAQVIAYGGPIPSDMIAASIRVPVTTIRAIQRALCDAGDGALGLAASRLLGAEGFVVPLPEHLDPLSRLLGYLDDLHNQSASPILPPPAR